MRRSLFLTSALLLVSLDALAQASGAPVFRPITTVPNMTMNKPAAAPAPAEQTPAAAPALAAPTTSASGLPVSRRNGEVIDSVGGDAIPALPIETQKENGITYLSGGVGEEEEAQLKSQENQYNLRVLITGENGEFLSDLTCSLKDAKGNTIVTISDAGPYVYMQVPPSASYTVEAVAPSGTGKKFAVKMPATGAIKTQLKL